MRLIDVDKLLYDDIDCEDGHTYMVVHAPEIDRQPTVEVPQWIPCSERLPKNQTESWWRTTEYLTCGKDGTIQVLCYCDGWNCSFLNADMDVYRYNEIKDIIAWMPLPQPYTENRKES